MNGQQLYIGIQLGCLDNFK